MYGLLLESIYEALKDRFGEETLDIIREEAGVEHHGFITHEYYSEQVIPRLASAVSEVTMTTFDEIMEYFGSQFVNFVGKYGYGTILRVLGRNMRDFLNGLDNLHEYLRLSYPKMRAPSFFCEDETSEGLTLHYRSKRRGFSFYVMGQIRQVGLKFYKTEVEIEILEDEIVNGMTHVIFQLHFDNKGFSDQQSVINLNQVSSDTYPVRPEIFFKVFPFHLVYGRNLVIRNGGNGLKEIMGELIGKRIDHLFVLTKPPMDFNFENVLSHTNNIFELTSVMVATKHGRRTKENLDYDLGGKDNLTVSDGAFLQNSILPQGAADEQDDLEDRSSHLRLRGQMRYMPSWDSFIFLANPILENMDRMYEMGLYINDLSMHDVSRDLVMVGTEQSKELKSAINQQKQKSKNLEEMMRLLDMEIKRTDSLLYQMIPKEVADRLRCGEPAVNTCQTFQAVSVLFSEVINFNEICSRIEPMGVVNLLNSMYTKFDTLTEKHHVYKVETIGDAYMVVSGAPLETRHHAVHICDMSLDMAKAMHRVGDPSDKGPGGHIKVKIGIHSGTVVAGIVGLKMPRYCLFGDTVNTASRMESNSEPMKIHISQVTRDELGLYPYTVKERGTIEVKGKGEMKTYWLLERTQPTATFLPSARASPNSFLSPMDPSSRRGSSLSDSSRTSSRVVSYTPVTFDQVAKSHISIKSLMAHAYEDTSSAECGGRNDDNEELPADGATDGIPPGCATSTCSVM